MNTKLVTYISILIGAAITIYEQVNEHENLYMLIVGLFLLMFGLYRLSRGIREEKPEQSYIVNDEEE